MLSRSAHALLRQLGLRKHLKVPVTSYHTLQYISVRPSTAFQSSDEVNNPTIVTDDGLCVAAMRMRRLVGRFASTNSGVVIDADHIQRSPYPDVSIPDDVGLSEHVLTNCDLYGDKIALIDGTTGASISYTQLKDTVRRLGHGLTQLGVQQGDVVMMFLPNCPEYVLLYLAITGIGAVASTINPLYTTGELKHAVNFAGASLIITTPQLVSVTTNAVSEAMDVVVVGDDVDGCIAYHSLLIHDNDKALENQKIHPREDTVILPFSSGTTGLPKGVMLTHYNIIANIEQIRTKEVLGYSPDDVMVGLLPFFHIYGQTLIMLCSIVEGCAIVTMPKFDPKMFLSIIETYKISYCHIAPPIALFLAQHPMVDQYDLSSINTMLNGAAPVSVNIVHQLLRRLNNPQLKFRVGYGMTEASPVTHCNPQELNKLKYDSIGRAVHNVSYKVIDIETGKTLPPHENGELLVKGPNVMKGYLNNDKETQETIVDGWLHTGDIGYYDNEGYVYITDRLKELIKVKGFQVAPAELENLLLSHPDIIDAAVIGRPDDLCGEIPRAYVVLADGATVSAEEVQDFVKGKVARYKELAGGVCFKKEIPKSLSGKILRRILKDELSEELSS